MRVVLLGGQGSERPGMGLGLAEVHPQARSLLHTASEATGVDVLELLRRGRPELTQTSILQPVLTAVSLGVWSWWGEQEDLETVEVAGHSAGELTAWAISGGIEAEDAIELAAERGRSMEAAAHAHPGGMAAVEVPDGRQAELLRAARELELEPAAMNAPGQWVVSGPKLGLRRLLAKWPGTMLPISGPWHHRSMETAARRFFDRARAVSTRPARRRWWSGGSAAPFGSDPASELAENMLRPVRWADLMQAVFRAGGRRFTVLGPGHGLQGLVRRNLGDAVRVEHLAGPSAEVNIP